MKNILISFFKTFFLILGIMVIPVLLLDLLVKQNDMTVLWWSLLFSFALAVMDVLFSESNILMEKITLKRILFVIFIIAIALATSWFMNILVTLEHVLLALTGCLIVAVPTLIFLSIQDKKSTEKLNEKLKEFNNTDSDINND